MSIKIIGTGSALPERAVSNEEIAGWVDTSDEWIRERTGIGERRISTGETVADLSAKACQMALESAGKKAEDVELLLVATCTPELALPCCACQVQMELGAWNAAAFDLNAACAGFLFALHTAYAYIESGLYNNALIAGAEVLSKMIDWEDRSTCVLFGDGAGAVMVEKSERGLISMTQGSTGSMVLKCRERDVQNPFVKSEAGIGYIEMNGQEVYRFATRQVPESIKEALKKAELTVEDIDYFVLHQANRRIIEAVAKRLKVDLSRFPMNMDRVGNISSAAIPTLLNEMNQAGILKKGMKLVLSGFGAGLTFGACVLEWQ